MTIKPTDYITSNLALMAKDLQKEKESHEKAYKKYRLKKNKIALEAIRDYTMVISEIAKLIKPAKELEDKLVEKAIEFSSTYETGNEFTEEKLKEIKEKFLEKIAKEIEEEIKKNKEREEKTIKNE